MPPAREYIFVNPSCSTKPLAMMSEFLPSLDIKTTGSPAVVDSLNLEINLGIKLPLLSKALIFKDPSIIPEDFIWSGDLISIRIRPSIILFYKSEDNNCSYKGGVASKTSISKINVELGAINSPAPVEP